MSVERENAVINEQIIFRVEFIFDRLGTNFNPDSITSVEILDSDGSTVLQTITGSDIIQDSTGKWHVVGASSWNTVAKSISDRWTFVKDGTTYIQILGTTIFDSTSPGTGMASFIELVKRKVKAPTVGLTVLTDPGDYEEFIEEALLEYSRRRPYQKTAKLTGDGTFFFSLPSDWNEEISFIRQVEYPVDYSPECILEPKKYTVVQLDTGYTGKFIGESYPGLNEYFYVRYTIPHTITASSNTINTIHKRAFVNLCAAITCMAVATKYGHTADSSVEADAIDYRSRGDEFAARSREYWKMFDKVIKPAVNSVIGELDAPLYWNGNRNGLNRENTMI
jgi:hypothetical protein